jgi:hypothetical protein
MADRHSLIKPGWRPDLSQTQHGTYGHFQVQLGNEEKAGCASLSRPTVLRCFYEHKSVSNDSRKSFIGVQVKADLEPRVGENARGHGRDYIVILSFLDSRMARKWACWC